MSVQFTERDYMMGEKGHESVHQGTAMLYEVGLLAGEPGLLMNSGQHTRVGEQVQAGSVLIGKRIVRATFFLRRTSTGATASAVATVRNAADAIRETSSNSIADVNAELPLNATKEFTFIFPNPVVLEAGDLILFEYAGGSSIRAEQAENRFDGGASRRQRYVAGYFPSDAFDITAKFYRF